MGDVVRCGVIQACATASAQELDIRRLVVHADENSLFDARLMLAASAKLWKPATVGLINVHLRKVYIRFRLMNSSWLSKDSIGLR